MSEKTMKGELTGAELRANSDVFEALSGDRRIPGLYRLAGMVSKGSSATIVFSRDPDSERLAELGRKVWEAVEGVQPQQIMACAKRLRSGLAYRVMGTLAAALAEMEAQNAVSSH